MCRACFWAWARAVEDSFLFYLTKPEMSVRAGPAVQGVVDREISNQVNIENLQGFPQEDPH